MSTKRLSTRRQFLAALSGLGLSAAAVKSLAAGTGRLPVITKIERDEIHIPYRSFNREMLLRYHGTRLQARTIYQVHTDQGAVGLGESWSIGPELERYQKYIGTSPFDWVGNTADLPMNMAMYDLMGKHLQLPVWKLIGPRVRNWTPVAAWTVSLPPKMMADEVKQVAKLGYRWIKYHIDECQNVVAQTEAMQKVAPPGFRVHYDFNANSTFEAVAPLMAKLEKYPIAGRVEDPINPQDEEGYRVLRQRSRIPILIHHGPVGFMRKGLCDGHMAGHASIGNAAKVAAIAEDTRTPFMLQQAGGTINQAFLAHEVAVFKMATIDHVNLCHLWEDEVTKQTMPVVGSSVKLPTGPGLGVELDQRKLAKYRTDPPVIPRFLVRIRYNDGLTIVTRHVADLPGCTDNLRFLGRLLKNDVPGPVPGYDNAVQTEYLGERHPDFGRLWPQTKNGKLVIPPKP